MRGETNRARRGDRSNGLVAIHDPRIPRAAKKSKPTGLPGSGCGTRRSPRRLTVLASGDADVERFQNVFGVGHGRLVDAVSVITTSDNYIVRAASTSGLRPVRPKPAGLRGRRPACPWFRQAGRPAPRPMGQPERLTSDDWSAADPPRIKSGTPGGGGMPIIAATDWSNPTGRSEKPGLGGRCEPGPSRIQRVRAVDGVSFRSSGRDGRVPAQTALTNHHLKMLSGLIYPTRHGRGAGLRAVEARIHPAAVSPGHGPENQLWWTTRRRQPLHRESTPGQADFDKTLRELTDLLASGNQYASRSRSFARRA